LNLIDADAALNGLREGRVKLGSITLLQGFEQTFSNGRRLRWADPGGYGFLSCQGSSSHHGESDGGSQGEGQQGSTTLHGSESGSPCSLPELSGIRLSSEPARFSVIVTTR